MDKELLEILKSIQEDITGIKISQKDTVEKLDTIETKLDHVFEQTIDLTEFRMNVIKISTPGVIPENSCSVVEGVFGLLLKHY